MATLPGSQLSPAPSPATKPDHGPLLGRGPRRTGDPRARGRSALPRITRLRGTSGQVALRRFGGLYLLLLVGIAVLSIGIYVNALATGPAHSIGPAPVVVDLGPPTVGRASCGNGTMLYTEVIPWDRSSETLTTSQIYVKLVELIDGDYIGGRDPPGTVTPTSLCAADPPSGAFDWYLVVGAPQQGPYESVFCYALGWGVVGGASLSAPIPPGSSLTLVSVRSFSNNGYALAIVGAVGGPTVEGAVTL
jgi:hypothetical protein